MNPIQENAENDVAGIMEPRLESPDALRRSLVIGNYALGLSDLSTAEQLSGIPGPEIIRVLREGAVRNGVQERGHHAPEEAGAPLLSVVVPVFNNATTLGELCARLRAELAKLGTFEIVFVDDGSSDGSAELLYGLAEAHPAAVRLLRLSRNFGQQAAISAGLDASRGSAVVIMDADLQDPPELIAEMVRQWRAGNDAVCTVRRNRKEGVVKRACYSVFYRCFRYLAEMDVPLDSGEFSLLDRKVVDTLCAMPERSRFLRGLRSWSGFRQTSIAYDRPARPSGESQYTVRRLFRLATDGLLAFSSVPLRISSLLGLLSSALGMALLCVIVVARLTTASLPLGWTSNLAVLLLVSGAQLATVGMLGAYVSRIYAEVKNRPLYIVMDRR
ncbi:glycosyltransferase family 2 protein [Streptomyces iconiensis]|uniref:Glycosyltransferase family 2 protein n=1 Tax=Streptomyces iconiensis TaxID=1384038 RepID=A0ABT7A1N0_9ACTN|nr:glycosyltransferase family 2 protein [Streptomyces iconiensis]MDJ1134982.1 glycosyltransferase family 2 protein [Streptomyces iconiensis]